MTEGGPGKEPAAQALGGLGNDLTVEVGGALEDGRAADAGVLVRGLHYADIADLLERLTADHRQRLVEVLREEFDPNILAELDDAVRERVMDQLGPGQVAAAVAELETDDALDVVEELDADDRKELLDALPAQDRTLIEEGLSFPEDSAGRLMQRHAVSVPVHWTVGQAIDYLRDQEGLPTDFFDIFLVDSIHRPVGAAPLSRVLGAKRHVALAAIMNADMKIVPVHMDQEEVAFLFRQRDLISAPVVDADGRLAGVITVDDIVDVIHEEHEEDVMRMAGVGGEGDLYAAIMVSIRSRFTWLLVHLCAAVIAAMVINHFSGTIEKMVALAVLMPIVAAMGGTASVQALAVSVRAIAMKELTSTNALRAIGKEVTVGLVNGILFAILIGIVAWFWFDNATLGLVIGLAIVTNLAVAGLAGSAVPILLQRWGVDPAVASSAFLTAITDVVGFYVFLGLAALLLF